MDTKQWRIGDAGRTIFGPPIPGQLPEVIVTGKNRANIRLAAAVVGGVD